MQFENSGAAPDIQSGQPFFITRRFHVSINGSIGGFNTSENAATWTPLNGKIGDVFGVNDVFQAVPDQTTTAAMLQNAVLHKVTVLEQKNDFPINLGVSIGCIPCEEITRSGHRYAVTAMANSHNPNPCVCFSAEQESSEGIEWRNKYPQYNTQNLETQGVLSVNNQPYLFVHEKHPVVEVLRLNKDILNQDIDAQPKIDGEWFKITRQVMGTCCQQLRQKILSKVSTRDLNQFSVQIHRLGNKDWSHVTTGDDILRAVPREVLETGDQERISNSIKAVINHPCSYSCRLEVQYEVRTAPLA